MTLPRARIIKAPSAGAAREVRVLRAAPKAGRALKAAVADAAIEASAKLAAADDRAHAILASAEQRAHALGEKARDEGRKAGAAELVASWVKLRTEENARDERDLDRTTELARVMAEHLIGEALALDPSKVRSIARQALASARQSRRVLLRAHPQDAEALRADLKSLGLERAAIEIHADPSRSRGSLLLDTDLGTIDANLPLQLDRLARSLRDSFRS